MFSLHAALVIDVWNSTNSTYAVSSESGF